MIGTRALKRWRENYYVGNALAAVTRPAFLISRRLSLGIQRIIKKNGAEIQLRNGRKLLFGRDAGVNLASRLFWNGLDGFEPETAKTLCFFFSGIFAFGGGGGK